MLHLEMQLGSSLNHQKQTNMKRIFSSSDSAEIGLLESTLTAAGIECELRNEALSQVIPALPFQEELWVLNDEDYAEASELIAAWKGNPPTGKQS
jgi:hypothetical protein